MLEMVLGDGVLVPRGDGGAVISARSSRAPASAV